MTDKERLEDIDKHAKHRVLENIRGEVRYRFTEINTEDYDWLIKQAERAKRYKQVLEYIQREIRRVIYTPKKQKWNLDQELFRKRLATLDWLIKQAERVQELEQQNKRYREYLRLIKATGTYGKDISTGEIIRSNEANLAAEALEG